MVIHVASGGPGTLSRAARRTAGLALLGSGGCGSDMKLIRMNLEISPHLWPTLSLFWVSVSLGVKLGTQVRTSWHHRTPGKVNG